MPEKHPIWYKSAGLSPLGADCLYQAARLSMTLSIRPYSADSAADR